MIINSYCGEDHTIGINFYDNRVYEFQEEDLGMRSYKFRLKLSTDKPWRPTFTKEYEIIEFIETLNLLDLPKGNSGFVLWWEYLKEHKPKLLEYHVERLKRKNSSTIIEPLYFKSYFNDNSEFLEFTEDTAYMWGGPFEREGKLGCAIELKESPTRDFPIDNIKSSWNTLYLPRDLYDKYYNEDLLDAEAKTAIYESFTLETKLHIAEKYIDYRKDHEWIHGCLPYKLYLCGNDDCSYTKYFCTKEEALAEQEYLRKTQPLDMRIDILNRGYFFTN
jgi:hypothetical protein